MKLRDPFLVENLLQDQPYASLLLIAPFCDGACYGCHNQVLTDHQVREFSVDQLIQEYRANPFVDGITVGGLEVCLSGAVFADELVEFVERANISRVTIYSRFDVEHPQLATLLQRLKKLACVRELYCKSGMYTHNGRSKEEQLRSGNRVWSLKLASENQSFHLIKGTEWQKISSEEPQATFPNTLSVASSSVPHFFDANVRQYAL